MGEEGGRKPSLDNPEYFLFPEDPASATTNRFPGEPAVMDRFPGEPAVMNRFNVEPTTTMDRRARTVSQVN